MSQPTRNSPSWISVLPSLVVPICLGLSLYVGMLAMIRHGVLENEMALRYLTGHPVSKVTVAMFLIGACSLALIAFNVFAQFASERELRFAPLSEDDGPGSDDSENDDVQTAIAFGTQLLEFPRSIQSHYLWQRLTNSLLYVYRNGSAAGVDEEVKYLAELDLDRQQQRYSLARILIWATPMLGFLGTVLGISQALGGISVGPENDFQDMMNGLRGSLYVAFDTTALALTLSMVLMFFQFLVDRFETQLLTMVDQRARSEIALQFDASVSEESVGDSVERLGQHLLTSTREMMVAQTEIWTKTIQSAEQAWASSLNETNERVRANWSESVELTLGRLAKSIDGSVLKADESMVRRWKQWQVMLSDNARLMCQQQQELASQTTALQSLVGNSSDDHAAKEALQGTLDAIKTTDQLTTAINDLSERLESLRLAKSDIAANADSADVPQEPASRTDKRNTEVIQSLARATSKKEVAVRRRQSQSVPAAQPKRGNVGKLAASKNSLNKEKVLNKKKSATKQDSKIAATLDEVILPIAPHLSAKKLPLTKRAAKIQAALAVSKRKAA